EKRLAIDTGAAQPDGHSGDVVMLFETGISAAVRIFPQQSSYVITYGSNATVAANNPVQVANTELIESS
ncbi:MAG: hypothetical protein JXA73_25175, partial [Acidobacteria bacterium]|nr:hypothetical protein [Acidobacteriota bacterium]